MCVHAPCCGPRHLAVLGLRRLLGACLPVRGFVVSRRCGRSLCSRALFFFVGFPLSLPSSRGGPDSHPVLQTSKTEVCFWLTAIRMWDLTLHQSPPLEPAPPESGSFGLSPGSHTATSEVHSPKVLCAGGLVTKKLLELARNTARSPF